MPRGRGGAKKRMNNLTTWLELGLAAAAVLALLLGLRVAAVRKQRAAQDAARQLAEQRRQQAAHNQALALAQAQAEAQRQETLAVAEARQRAQAVLLAQRQAAAAEREARRRAADEAARQHAQGLLDKRLAERAAAADANAAARAWAPPPTAPAPAAPAPMAPAAPRATVQVHVPPAPALRPAPAPALAPALPLPRTRADTVVLVADDSKVVRVKIGRLLEQHGFQVMLAEDGLAALRQMQLQVPHVLLTDAEMPGLDGLALTRKVRSLPHMAHVMVLMISSADGSLGEAARAAGVTALLGKPYAEDQLLAHLDRVRRPATAAATTSTST